METLGRKAGGGRLGALGSFRMVESEDVGKRVAVPIAFFLPIISMKILNEQSFPCFFS